MGGAGGPQCGVSTQGSYGALRGQRAPGGPGQWLNLEMSGHSFQSWHSTVLGGGDPDVSALVLQLVDRLISDMGRSAMHTGCQTGAKPPVGGAWVWTQGIVGVSGAKEGLDRSQQQRVLRAGRLETGGSHIF